MIRKLGIIVGCLFIVAAVLAQLSDPVHFSYNVSKSGDKSFTVHITATMDPGWHIYAEVQPKSAISIPTKIAFSKNPLVILRGKIKEVGKIEKQKIEEVGIEQNMYEKTVDFIQNITLKANVKTN